MTADIVNLNKFRKAKAREEKEKLAEQNRAKFGRSKEQRRSDADDAAKREHRLDGAKLENDADADGFKASDPEAGDHGDNS
jgi:hypothetical protein